MNIKFSWAITAGDQIGESPDDQKCGDHYIEKGLECHDGDAHRPTPGKNPYWQGGRKGSGDKSKSKKGDSGKRGEPHKRDKSERTERSKKHGQEGGKEEQAKFAVERFDHYADMMEQADPGMEWTPDKKYELVEMVMRDTAREFSLDSSELGYTDPSAIYYGPLDNWLSSRRRGRKGRSMWRPRQDEQYGPGTDVYLPAPHKNREGLIKDVEERTPRGKEEPRRRDAVDHTKKKKEPTESMVNDLHWASSRIMQDRRENMYGPDDVSVSRPCGEGEDPREGHCNPNLSPESRGLHPRPEYETGLPQGPQTDAPKALRKMGPGSAEKDIGLAPKKDPARGQRVAQHVQNLKRTGGDAKKASWAMSKMFPGTKAKPTADGSGVGGEAPASSMEEAQLRHDDAKVALEQAGWQNISDMGGRSAYTKEGLRLAISRGRSPSGGFANKFTVIGPQQAKKKGWFR